jgi:hypothetical protein
MKFFPQLVSSMLKDDRIRLQHMLDAVNEAGTCQWTETHPVKKLLYNIRAWLIFNPAHTPNHCLIVR